MQRCILTFKIQFWYRASALKFLLIGEVHLTTHGPTNSSTHISYPEHWRSSSRLTIISWLRPQWVEYSILSHAFHVNMNLFKSEASCRLLPHRWGGHFKFLTSKKSKIFFLNFPPCISFSGLRRSWITLYKKLPYNFPQNILLIWNLTKNFPQLIWNFYIILTKTFPRQQTFNNIKCQFFKYFLSKLPKIYSEYYAKYDQNLRTKFSRKIHKKQFKNSKILLKI